jgi:hypothetical protein
MGSPAEREQRSMQPSKLYRGTLANMLLGMLVFTSFTHATRRPQCRKRSCNSAKPTARFRPTCS